VSGPAISRPGRLRFMGWSHDARRTNNTPSVMWRDGQSHCVRLARCFSLCVGLVLQRASRNPQADLVSTPRIRECFDAAWGTALFFVPDKGLKLVTRLWHGANALRGRPREGMRQSRQQDQKRIPTLEDATGFGGKRATNQGFFDEADGAYCPLCRRHTTQVSSDLDARPGNVDGRETKMQQLGDLWPEAQGKGSEDELRLTGKDGSDLME
jgi:hypothetical protein